MKAAIVALAILVAGCKQWQPFHPERRSSVGDRQAATEEAARELVARGYTPDVSASGVIVTAWQDVKVGMKPYPQVRWSISIGSDVTVDLQCRFTNDEDCGEKRPPGDWQRQAAEIADAITNAR